MPLEAGTELGPYQIQSKLLWSQPIDGGEAKQLTRFLSETIFNFGRSRDGKQFAIARGTSSGDIILIKDFQ